MAMGIDDLIALNAEIAALVRAGVPLERGLLGLGTDVPGRLGAIARELGTRMERGASLDEALRDGEPAIPATYRAVVEAGRRAGRLPAALEGIASYARGYAELRRMVGSALLYPTVVMLIGYALLLAFFWFLLPRIGEAFEALGVAEPKVVDMLERIGSAIGWWGPILPCAVVIAAGIWWCLGRARGLDAVSALGWVPWLGVVLRDARAANFASWLSLLLENEVPLPEGIELAARASGDRDLNRLAQSWADAARRGEVSNMAGQHDVDGPRAVLRWLLSGARSERGLARALAHVASVYRTRAAHRAELLSTVLPSVLLLTIGGITALLYVLFLMLPWAGLMESLAGQAS